MIQDMLNRWTLGQERSNLCMDPDHRAQFSTKLRRLAVAGAAPPNRTSL